jgi:hypothetical protein
MKIEDVIENSDNKIIFLKAILLGIKYGKLHNWDFYEKSILHELQKMTKDEKYTDNLINKMDTRINQSKINKQIYDLENVRNNIIKNINNLSYNNYNNNFVKINYLRNQLYSINKELDNCQNQLSQMIHKAK